MNRAQRRAEYRAARRRPVERAAQKRASLSFVTGVLLGIALPMLLLLTGCGESERGVRPMTEDEKFTYCVERGGSWKVDRLEKQESCTAPEEE